VRGNRYGSDVALCYGCCVLLLLLLLLLLQA
jgi:hypothetical protein